MLSNKARNGRRLSPRSKLEKKILTLLTTRKLSKIIWAIKGFLDNDLNIVYPQTGGGVVNLSPELPLIIVSDLHGLRDSFATLLFKRNYFNGESNLDVLLQGKAQIVMLGDALHSENKSLWTNKLIDEYMDQYVHHHFYGPMPAAENEMLDCLGAVSAIMALLRESCCFYYLKGNHDNIGNTETDGNSKVLKYLDNHDHGEGAIFNAAIESWIVRHLLKNEGKRSWEGFIEERQKLDETLIHKASSLEVYFKLYNQWLEDLNYMKGKGGWIFYNEFVNKYSDWEKRLPLFALYKGVSHNLVLSHSPPGHLKIKSIAEIERKKAEVIFNFTWPNDKKARAGEFVQPILDLAFPDNRKESSLYISGHINTEKGVETHHENRLMIINKPGSLVVLIVYPGRKIFGIDII